MGSEGDMGRMLMLRLRALSRTRNRQALSVAIARRELRLRETSKKITTPRPPLPNTHLHPEELRDTAKMKLNLKNIRYLSSDDWRVLTAVCAPSLQRHSGGLTLMETPADRNG